MRQSLKWRLGVFVLYGCIALIMTLPVATRITTHLAGSGGDPWQTIWRFEHKYLLLENAWSDGAVGQFLKEEFLGAGEPRLVNLSVWPWMPMHILFGQPTAYNLIWLISFSLAGFSMYLLVRYLLQAHATAITTPEQMEISAILSGVFYMLLPYHFAHSLGHFGAMQTFWLPLLLLTLFSFLDKPSWPKTFAITALTFIQAWTEHHYVLWFSIAALVILVWQHKRVKKLLRTTRVQLMAAISILILCGLVLLPYVPTIRASSVPETTLQLGIEQTIRFSADLFSYVIPSPLHTVMGKPLTILFERVWGENTAETTQYLGLSVLLLILFFHQSIPKPQKKLWVTLATLFFIISLGPRLKLLGYATSAPLPYALFDQLPIFDAIRSVGRASVFVGISLAVLLGYVCATQFKRRSSIAILTLFLFAEFVSLPIPTQSASMERIYGMVREQAGTRILEIPAATNYAVASKALYASLDHGKEIVGNIALERGNNKQELEFARSVPAIRQVLYVRPTALLEKRSEFFDQDLQETFWDTAAWLDVSTVLLHIDSVSADQRSALQNFLEQQLLLKPQVIDDMILYTLDANQAKHDGVFLWRKEGWVSVSFDAERNISIATFKQKASATVVNTTTRNQNARISFKVGEKSTSPVNVRSATAEISQTMYEADDAATIEFVVPPGETIVNFDGQPNATSILENPKFEVVTSHL